MSGGPAGVKGRIYPPSNAIAAVGLVTTQIAIAAAEGVYPPCLILLKSAAPQYKMECEPEAIGNCCRRGNLPLGFLWNCCCGGYTPSGKNGQLLLHLLLVTLW